MKLIPKFKRGKRILKAKDGLTTRQKYDILRHSYSGLDLDTTKNPQPLWEEDLDHLSDEELERRYGKGIDEEYLNSRNSYYLPSGLGPTVIGHRPLFLKTWYPMIHPSFNPKLDRDYKLTGHSYFGASDLQWENYDPEFSEEPIPDITGYFSDPGYNLFLNNCSDSTRRAVEAIFEEKMNPFLFTTPGDVRDFVLQHGGISKDKDNRTIMIPMNEERYKRLINSDIYKESLKRWEE